MKRISRLLLLAASLAAGPLTGQSQFIDEFDGSKLEGWFTMTGDGTPKMELVPKGGYVRFMADGSEDRYGVWWTLMKRDIAAHIDLEKLKDPAYELRVETKIRVSHAPRRVNFMLNTQRTTNFHEHLREFDIPDTTEWHVISMTTKDFDAVPGDNVYVQFAMTDWGPGKYYVDMDYYRADVVRRDTAGPDKGEPLVYHPPVRDVKTLEQHVRVAHDSLINSEYPDVNFNNWRLVEASGPARTLTLAANQWAVLRWDFSAFRNQKADGAGVLELTTASVALGGNYEEAWGKDFGEEFGKIRVIEILGGDPTWEQETVTFSRLLGGRPYEQVFNTQMVIDLEVAEQPGGKAYFTLPRPVMQRLLDGTTQGLLIRPLGAIHPSVYASEDAGGRGPVLHFSTRN